MIGQEIADAIEKIIDAKLNFFKEQGTLGLSMDKVINDRILAGAKNDFASKIEQALQSR